MSLVNLSAMGYPKLKTFRVLQEGILSDCRFELRGELSTEAEIDHAGVGQFDRLEPPAVQRIFRSAGTPCNLCL